MLKGNETIKTDPRFDEHVNISEDLTEARRRSITTVREIPKGIAFVKDGATLALINRAPRALTLCQANM